MHPNRGGEIFCLDCRLPLRIQDMVYHIIRRHPVRARAVLKAIRARPLARAEAPEAVVRAHADHLLHM